MRIKFTRVTSNRARCPGMSQLQVSVRVWDEGGVRVKVRGWGLGHPRTVVDNPR